MALRPLAVLCLGFIWELYPEEYLLMGLPFFSILFSPGCSGIAWNSWSPWHEGTQSESLLNHPSSQSTSPSPKGPWCVLWWWQLQQSQGIESRLPKKLPSIGKETQTEGLCETLHQLGFSPARRRGMAEVAS